MSDESPYSAGVLSIMRWYAQRWFPERDPAEKATTALVFGRLRTYMNEYNRMNGPVCSGMRWMKLPNWASGSRCNHPMCPTCWHIAHTKVLNAIHSLPGDHNFHHIRSIPPEHWEKEPTKEVITRFKARSTTFKLVAYTVNFYGDREQSFASLSGVDTHQSQELHYTVDGVFVSKNIPATQNRAHEDHTTGQTALYRVGRYKDPSKRVGTFLGAIERDTVRRDYLTSDGADDDYGTSQSVRKRREYVVGQLEAKMLERMMHPFDFVKHERFADYQRFRVHRALGRSWTYVKSKLPAS